MCRVPRRYPYDFPIVQCLPVQKVVDNPSWIYKGLFLYLACSNSTEEKGQKKKRQKHVRDAPYACAQLPITRVCIGAFITVKVQGMEEVDGIIVTALKDLGW